MVEPLQDYEFCYHCGWLGMCTVACPLLDPAHMISPHISTAPGLEAELDVPSFEILLEEKPPEGQDQE